MSRWAAAAAAVAAVALLAGAASTARAQIGGRPPTRPGQPRTPARPDTLRTAADSAAAARDTIARANFAPPDSVMLRLLNTPGYSVTQYQGEQISFDAVTRAIQLTRKAIVERDSQLVKSDTISYNGQGSAVRVGTDSAGRSVFAAPGQAPIVSHGPGTYDIATRRASVQNIRTSLPQSGEVLQITGKQFVAVAGRDSVKSANNATYYLRDGTITACDDSIPDYYFKAKEIKRTGSFVVARPAVLYIGDVPVMWLPFLFQDIRGGRHSGILSPNFGISDIVRNSPSYRRQIEGLGYYWAISDFLDTQASLDWRSSAGQVDLNDISFTRYNGEVRYRWLERYISGNLATGYTIQGAQRNTAISWGHSEDFTRNSSLRMDLNYASNTTLQRSTFVNPYAVLSTIRSSATYHQKVGLADFTLGGSRSEQPGRTQVDMTWPTFSVNTSPLNLGSWLTWTPSLSYTSHRLTGIDQPSSLGTLLRVGQTAAGVDTIFGDTLRNRNAYDSNLSFDTPLTIFGYAIGNRFTVASHRNDFPEAAIVTNVETGQAVERIFTTTYGTQLDWTPNFTLPPLARNNYNLSASVALANVDPSAYAIRNERTGGQWVHQSKRPQFSLAASPTLFGLFDGFGPFTRIRHSISPTFTYSYAPAANVSDEFLAALGLTRAGANGQPTGYLGALRQNSLTFQLSTNVEAKTRARNDSNPEAGEKLKLLSLNFTGLTYDIERAHYTHQAIRGLTTDQFGYTLRSDLLPGFDLGVDYSLFQGSTLSDTAKFSPFLTRITASFSFSNTANPFAVFERLFGRAVPASEASTDVLQKPADDRYARQVASQPVAGRSSRNAAFMPTVTRGWNASFQFSTTRQRPVVGANVVQFDAASRCTQFNTPDLVRLGVYAQCIARESTNPTVETPVTSGLAGSPIYLLPNVTTLGGNMNFNVTEHWAASWQTTYDFEHRNFASQIVSLQRDLHDWRAIFAFTQASTGSFAFNFLISLKAEPELKFDYHKSTYKNEGF